MDGYGNFKACKPLHVYKVIYVLQFTPLAILVFIAVLFFHADPHVFWSTSRKATNIVMALQQEFHMHIYSAYVRANCLVVQTQVCANNVSDAINLLKGMYGSDNLVHLPQLVS